MQVVTVSDSQKSNKWKSYFHLMPPGGRMNKPVGLCFYKNFYHVFFQYVPLSDGMGLKTWGHYRGIDLLHWEFLGDAVSPEDTYEKDGVGSGSVLVKDNVIHLFYTGHLVSEDVLDYFGGDVRESVYYARCEDGVHVTDKRLILRPEDYPEDVTVHVRNPKVFEEDGRYYMVLGAMDKQNRGMALLYVSDNLTDWMFMNRIGPEPGDLRYGYMWESPELFQLEGERFLSACPQGMLPYEFQYLNIHQTGYFPLAGDMCGKYELGEFMEWDRGFDFYAPQTFVDNQGRRILIGLLGMPDAIEYGTPTARFGWQHMLSIPRELSLKDGKIYQNPVKEMERLRYSRIQLSSARIVYSLDAFEVVVENPYSNECEILIGDQLILEYRRDEKVFVMHFSGNMGAGRQDRFVEMDKCYRMRIFADTSSVEIFLNDGEYVVSTRYYSEHDEVSVLVNGFQCSNTLWEIKKMKVIYN